MTHNTSVGLAFLAIILITVVVLSLKRYFTERKFREEWRRDTGRPWSSYGEGSDRGESL